MAFFPVVANAQSQCPLSITTISKGGDVIWFKYTNNSGKTITGTEFKSVFVDPVGNAVPGGKMVSGERVKPGKKHYQRYAEYLHQDRDYKTVISLQTVVFDDGTRWEAKDSGCSWSQ